MLDIMFDSLPSEQIHQIVNQINSPDDFIQFSQINKRTHAICHDPYFLKERITKKFPNITLPENSNAHILFVLYMKLLLINEANEFLNIMIPTSFAEVRDKVMTSSVELLNKIHSGDRAASAQKLQTQLNQFKQRLNQPETLIDVLLYIIKKGTGHDLQLVYRLNSNSISPEGLLLFCAQYGNPEMVRFCFTLKNVNLNHKDCLQKNALFYLRERENQSENIEILLNAIEKLPSNATPLAVGTNQDLIHRSSHLLSQFKRAIDSDNAHPYKSEFQECINIINTLRDLSQVINNSAYLKIELLSKRIFDMVKIFETKSNERINQFSFFSWRKVSTHDIKLASFALQLNEFVTIFIQKYLSQTMKALLLSPFPGDETPTMFMREYAAEHPGDFHPLIHDNIKQLNIASYDARQLITAFSLCVLCTNAGHFTNLDGCVTLQNINDLLYETLSKNELIKKIKPTQPTPQSTARNKP